MTTNDPIRPRPAARRAPRAVLLASLLAVAAGPAAAQDPAGGRPAPEEPVRVEAPAFRFLGGSLEELVGAWSDYYGAMDEGRRPNILLHPDARTKPVPGFELQGVTSTVSVLRTVAELVELEYEVDVEQTGGGGGSADVWVVRTRPRRGNGISKRPAQVRTEVLSLRGLVAFPGAPSVEGLSISDEVALSAIDTALQLAGSEPPQAVVRYHASSNLVFVRATAEQVNLVRGVVSQLELDLGQAREHWRRHDRSGGTTEQSASGSSSGGGSGGASGGGSGSREKKRD